MQAIAKKNAITILANQPPTIAHIEVEEVFSDINPNERPHTSHDIQTLQNNDDIICLQRVQCMVGEANSQEFDEAM